MFRPRASPLPSHSDDMQRMEQAAGGEDLKTLLQAIEESALRLYARHGLPTVSGHYRSRGHDDAWVALGAQLSAAERWAMIHESADGEWRYATLEAIGARSEHAEVRQASAILCACSGLRQRMRSHPAIAQDLADSIRLGAAWQAFETAPAALDAPISPPSPQTLPTASRQSKPA